MRSDPLGERLKSRVGAGRKLLVPYITCGLPGEAEFVDLYCGLAKDADAIEVGIPFSDPVMDGPVIQQSSVRALAEGATVERCLAMIEQVASGGDAPAVVMTYFNPVHSYGLAGFAQAMAQANVAGVIVPDLPYEECAELDEVLAARDIALIQLVAPTTPGERASMLAAASRGWVYAVSRMGVTGIRDSLAGGAAELVRRIKPHTGLPVLLGVGISSPEIAHRACRVADGVIVGAAVVGRVLDGDVKGALNLVQSMRREIDGLTGAGSGT
ncbi:MAG: tryptophan synthase subunit alpha [Actinomycetota bacterium]